MKIKNFLCAFLACVFFFSCASDRGSCQKPPDSDSKPCYHRQCQRPSNKDCFVTLALVSAAASGLVAGFSGFYVWYALDLPKKPYPACINKLTQCKGSSSPSDFEMRDPPNLTPYLITLGVSGSSFLASFLAYCALRCCDRSIENLSKYLAKRFPPKNPHMSDEDKNLV